MEGLGTQREAHRGSTETEAHRERGGTDKKAGGTERHTHREQGTHRGLGAGKRERYGK